MKKLLISPLVLLAVLFLFILGCVPDDYETVTIGTQVWMKHNLNIETGISWCYDEDPANCEIYGRLYDWETAKSACPPGWHLPSDAEWITLTDYLRDNAGGKMKSTRTEPDPHPRWRSPNTDATNESGWSGLPGGYGYSNSYSNFYDLGIYGYWWSSTEGGVDYAWGRSLGFDNGLTSRAGSDKGDGLSVRCIMD